MRIIHFVSSDKISGLEILAMNMLSELSGEHEVYYSCPDGDGISVARSRGIGTIVCNTRSAKDIKRVCKEYIPDIVHAHDPAVSFTCALAGVKFVSQLHCNCDWLPKLCPNSLALLFVCLRAKKVICVSESIVDEYVFKDQLAKKAVILSNYVDRDNVINASKETIDGRFDICSVARLTSHKQPLVFVELVKKLKAVKNDIKAVMIGDGELRAEVEKAITKEGLENNITLTGFERNPHKLVKASKVSVLTSKYEGFGLVAVEAMLLGKPFIAFPVGGLTDIVNDECGKLCDSVDEMAEETIKLLSDEAYYVSKSSNAEKISYRFTDKQAYINNILNIYKN